MKAYTLTSYRNGGELAWADIPRPSVNKGQVLVKVSAAGINPLDRMIARGDFKQLISYRLPQTLGHECSGEIVEVGADVHNLAAPALLKSAHLLNMWFLTPTM